METFGVEGRTQSSELRTPHPLSRVVLVQRIRAQLGDAVDLSARLMEHLFCRQKELLGSYLLM